MVLMTLKGIFYGLFLSCTYGCGMEVTTPEHATLMYGVLTLATGIGSFAASYLTGRFTKHTRDLENQNYLFKARRRYYMFVISKDNLKQLLCAANSVIFFCLCCQQCDIFLFHLWQKKVMVRT